jgi:DNA-binding transcriptional LysR family regulator
VCNSPPPHEAVWTKVLRTERRVLLVPEANPLAACSELHAEQALGETFVDFHPSVDPAWAAFWSLDDERGGPPESVTGDRVVNPQEVLAALGIRSAVTVVPAAVAAVVSGLIEDVRAVPVTDAAPARICLVGHLERLNPLVGALLAFAGGGQSPGVEGRQLRPGPL